MVAAHTELIEQYRRGAPAVRSAVEGLSAAQLRAVPVAGTWSIQQIVLHLLDSDLVASDRMKRIIAEENPTLIGFDETAFSKRLFYQEADVPLAAELFEKNRILTAAILSRLPAEDFQRIGTHNQRGPVQLGQLLSGSVDHLEHHLGHLRRKRQLLENPR